MQTLNPAFYRLTILLWGVLFLKCFTLEYLSRVYAAPVNTVYYVWGLSLMMASVATVLKFSDSIKMIKGPWNVRRALLVWTGCGLIIAGLSAYTLLLGSMTANHTLAIIALVMAVGSFSQGVIEHRFAEVVLALGWIVGSGILARQTEPGCFGLFAILIALLSITPRLLTKNPPFNKQV